MITNFILFCLKGAVSGEIFLVWVVSNLYHLKVLGRKKFYLGIFKDVHFFHMIHHFMTPSSGPGWIGRVKRISIPYLITLVEGRCTQYPVRLPSTKQGHLTEDNNP